MTSYLNKKNKLQYIYNSQNNTQTNSIRQQQKNNNIDKKINQEMSIYCHMKKFNEWIIDWEDFDTNDGDEYYKRWEIDFGRFDIRLLPFIEINQLIRLSYGSIQDSHPGCRGELSKIFHIMNINEEASDYYKNVNLIVSSYFKSTFQYPITGNYQSKLIISFQNPRQY